jgi:hypothetical protein
VAVNAVTAAAINAPLQHLFRIMVAP